MTGSMTNQWLGMATVLPALDRQLQTSVANDCKDMRDELKGELSSLFNKMLDMLLLFVEDRDRRLYSESPLTGIKLMVLRLPSWLHSD